MNSLNSEHNLLSDKDLLYQSDLKSMEQKNLQLNASSLILENIVTELVFLGSA